MKRESVILTLKQLESRGRYWQKILRLEDWEIFYKIVDEFSDGKDKAGECRVAELHKAAVVSIVAPYNFKQYEWPQDMELDLLHELCHVHFYAWPGGSDNMATREEEWAVQCFSQALLQLDRERRGWILGPKEARTKPKKRT